ncbi:glycosyltransferase family 4 protein [Nocardioides cavernae]|uniref:Glycosyltransferase family 4 protein n=1 Tax=Nocardioides cavernae TaxID=1921566 RepID=A0ABR8NIC1_9ACTN|nr:glycosyltransferase family 1 protein [Nocardioides cavernae]MBD3926654.1 glycosyltransferase family 4 protein [Nocardioides cavernae]MBM7512376.1 glycosyltransferase involved in cell wall biosynthesis [Nocardioides cavernae]
MTRPLVFVDMLSYTGTKGGMETYTRELYRELGRMDTGFDFVALASREGARLDLDWFPGEVIRSRISGENRVVWAFGELVASSVHARRRRADLVHCPATLGPARTSMPTVITLHDMLYWSHPESMVTPFYTRPVMWMERRAVANATRVITDSDVSAAEIRKYLHFPSERLHVVPLAARAPEVVAPYRGEENLVVASGQRRPYKNWEGLIRALALVEESVRPRLVITGADPGEDPLRPVVDECGLSPWVDLRGWVDADELADLRTRARALAFPTLAEGFGLPVLEAMSIGLPVIASDLPVLREVGGDAALWFDPRDPGSIAGALRAVATDREAMLRASRAGLDQAAGFSWRRVAEETLDVFRVTLDDR